MKFNFSPLAMTKGQMMQTCDTCRYYWAPQYRINTNMGSCNCAKLCRDNIKDQEENELTCADFLGDGAKIFVGPKFGCIHHAPKP